MLIVCLSSPIGAKSRSLPALRSMPMQNVTRTSLLSMEQRLTPFLNARVSRRSIRTLALQVPQEADLRTVAREWNSLSPAFRDLYRRATQIPATYRVYATPGGHFEVYYTTDDPASAVASTDSVGYGTADWRIRLHGQNGVPDYIDDVAWALDSVWSMEIDRFGFVAPSPSDTSRGNPLLYKVVVTEQADDYYAMTFPGGRVSKTGIGFASLIEIRNTWKGWTIPPYIDYDQRPEKGVHVSCAHEFFHAVQYGMTRNLVGVAGLDDFPLAWLEGTAVLMEELVFDEINDYLQYADAYFADPTQPLLNDNYNHDPYRNGLLAMYLYRFAAARPGINFIKTVMDRNYQSATSFPDVLFQASVDLGTTWRKLLGDFHTASYFTGGRADTAVFLRDAALLPQWSFELDNVRPGATLSKTVLSQGMKTFSFGRGAVPAETLTVAMRAWDLSQRRRIQDDLWGVNLLLMDTSASTMQWRALPVTDLGTADTTMRDWRAFDIALLVVSNADFSQDKAAAVGFNSIGGFVSGVLKVCPNPVSISQRREQPLLLVGEPVTGVRVYSSGGTLVSHVEFGEDATGPAVGAWRKESPQAVVWHAENDVGKPVIPGMYCLVIAYVQAYDGSRHTRKAKVLVVP